MSMMGGDGHPKPKPLASFLQAFFAKRITLKDNDLCQIEEGLYLGSLGAAGDKDGLKKLNITHILSVMRSLNPTFPDEFLYKTIDVLDSPDTNLAQYFDECFEFIEEARRLGGGVLVHCFAGISRSATIVLAYLMKKHRMSLSQALELVRSKRPRISPNHGFKKQLEMFEKSLQVTQDAKASESLN